MNKPVCIISSTATAPRLTSLASQLANDPTPFEGLVSVPAKVLKLKLVKGEPQGYYKHCWEAGRALVESLEAFVGESRIRRIA